MMRIETALEHIETKDLKRLGSAMLDRLESTQKYATDDLDIPIIDYLIIGSSNTSFKLNEQALSEIENREELIATAAIAAGMCEMSEIIIKLNKEIKGRQ